MELEGVEALSSHNFHGTNNCNCSCRCHGRCSLLSFSFCFRLRPAKTDYLTAYATLSLIWALLGLLILGQNSQTAVLSWYYVLNFFLNDSNSRLLIWRILSEGETIRPHTSDPHNSHTPLFKNKKGSINLMRKSKSSTRKKKIIINFHFVSTFSKKFLQFFTLITV